VHDAAARTGRTTLSEISAPAPRLRPGRRLQGLVLQLLHLGDAVVEDLRRERRLL
jgi:hypothetical protein